MTTRQLSCARCKVACFVDAGVFRDLYSSLVYVITVILDPLHVVLLVFYSCILRITAEVRIFQRCTTHQPHMRVISIIIIHAYLANLTGCLFLPVHANDPHGPLNSCQLSRDACTPSIQILLDHSSISMHPQNASHMHRVLFFVLCLALHTPFSTGCACQSHIHLVNTRSP